MRRIAILTIAGLALVTLGCSSSEEPTATSTTTSSVVVTPANQPTCDAIEAFNTAGAGTPEFEEGGDPTANAAAIQAFLQTLVAPLEAVLAVAPPELKADVQYLIDSAKETVALDPSTAENQTAIGQAILAPPPETAEARAALIDWAKNNCGVTVR